MLAAARQWHWLAVADLFDRDQRHVRENLGILQFPAELLVGAHLRQHETLLCRSHLEFIGAPLENRVVDRLGALAASEEVERARTQLRIEIQSHHVTAVACLAEVTAA